MLKNATNLFSITQDGGGMKTRRSELKLFLGTNPLSVGRRFFLGRARKEEEEEEDGCGWGSEDGGEGEETTAKWAEGEGGNLAFWVD